MVSAPAPARAARVLAWVLATAHLLSCSDDPAAPAADASTDASALVDAEDASAPDADANASDGTGRGGTDGFSFDVPTGENCPGGMLCTCEVDDDCDSSACIDTLFGKRCTVTCLQECPDGFACEQPVGGGDQATYCFPRWGPICRPCNLDTSCVAAGNTESVCVRHGDEGGYCGSECSADADCPAGFSCAEVDAVGGGAYQQCIRNNATGTPDCACSPAAVAAGWSTTCWNAEKDAAGKVVRRCKGQRACTEAGLSACEPVDPAVCFDVQCLLGGQTGADPLPDGTACEDGNDCTKGDQCAAGQCTAGTFVCDCDKDADCEDDGDLCNGVPYCDKSGEVPACKLNPATVVTCDISTDTACNKTVCVKSTGACVQEPTLANEACDDGVACTADDHCDGKGACIPGVSTCPCKTSADCPDDADLCNGVPFCDTAADVPTCKPNPATLVVCDGSADSACVKNTCLPLAGTCTPTQLPDGAPCADGESCTADDVCTGGACVGKPVCTCATSADCEDKDDGDLCNGTLFCDVASKNCKLNKASVVNCSSVDDTACAVNACQPKTGACALVALENKACEDGTACTSGDACKGGLCAPGTNTCTCKEDADCAAHEDGDLCNGTLFCDKSSNTCEVNPASLVSCPNVDDTACAKNTCQPKSGVCEVQKLLDGAPCKDDNACTSEEVCVGSQCVGGKNACTCQSDADCAGKDDGDLCNGTLYCNTMTSLCEVNPSTVPSCDAGADTACLASQCVHVFDLAGAATSTTCKLLPRPDGKVCDDGVACTEGDLCKAGACVSGKKVCGCKTDGDCQTGTPNLCQEPATCVAGSCVDGKDKSCPTEGETECLGNVCDPTTGACALVPKNEAKICDDGDPCSAQSSCKEGACLLLVATNCDDGNVCTNDACDPKVSGGCTHSNNKSGCDDGSKCTASDFCFGGVCKGGSPPPEVCGNGIDDDCDGVKDEEGAVGCQTYYYDGDGDGYSTKSSKCLCKVGQVAKYTVSAPDKINKDCNDNDSGIKPGAAEDCTATDRNCDGHSQLAGQSAPTNLTGCQSWFYDNDQDGFAVNTFKSKCLCKGDTASKYSTKLTGDCDDNNAKVSPLQFSYQTKPRSNGSWDWNCDGKVVKQWEKPASCPGKSSCIANMTKGFSGGAECGETKTFVVECAKKPVQCKSSKTEQRTQACL